MGYLSDHDKDVLQSSGARVLQLPAIPFPDFKRAAKVRGACAVVLAVVLAVAVVCVCVCVCVRGVCVRRW